MKGKYKILISIDDTIENLEELKYFVTGALADIVFQKEFYQSNIQLKEFTKNYLNEDYKDYLFKARPTLYARIVGDIMNKDNDEAALKKIISTKNFLLEKEPDSKKVIENNNKDKKKIKRNYIDEWSQIIHPKGK